MSSFFGYVYNGIYSGSTKVQNVHSCISPTINRATLYCFSLFFFGYHESDVVGNCHLEKKFVQVITSCLESVPNTDKGLVRDLLPISAD